MKKISLFLLLIFLACTNEVIKNPKIKQLDDYIKNEQKEIKIIKEVLIEKRKNPSSISSKEIEELINKLDLTEKTLENYSFIIKENERLQKELKECSDNNFNRLRNLIYAFGAGFVIGLLINLILPTLFKILKAFIST
jgi:tetrahydromethanopterin S-methyltransferase subunit G